jgi:ribosomal protein S18 acetylase RimI-like enzyme
MMASPQKSATKYPAPAIRAIAKDDYERWSVLWDANNQGQNDSKVTATTWARLNDNDSAVNGLVAIVDDRPVGLVHYILHPTTGSLNEVCYVQDVFVDPAYRQRGYATAMMQELANEGRKRNWARLYWLAEADNFAAQMLYKRLGVRLNFSLHVMPM